MKIREVGFEELQLCPAAVEVDSTGEPTILVNRITFPTAEPFAQKFFLAHELGHYLLSTSDEEVADAFALHLLAGTEHKSLKRSIAALYSIHNIPYSRMLTLYNLALTIDKQHQNHFNIMKKKVWDNPTSNRNFFGRADGEEAETPSVTPQDPTGNPQASSAVAAANILGDILVGNNRRRAGLRINNVFFSMESIVLAAILIVLVVIACKK